MQFSLPGGKVLPLLVSVWIIDENRYSKLLEQRPESFLIWKFVAIIWICYQNYCRRNKIELSATIEDVELQVETLLSDKAGKNELISLTQKITEEMNAFYEDESADKEKKIQPKTKASRTRKPGKR